MLLSPIIKKLATDEKGNFSTALSSGKYILTFQFVGMKSLQQQIEIKEENSSIDLGTILLTESSTQLDEISVVAQKPLVKVDIDKLVYSAKDDPEATTSNVLDMLRKVPMVTVDGEDNIQLKGSSNYKIYLNGKPSNMISSNPSQVLKSMPANNVKDIEVITEPAQNMMPKEWGELSTLLPISVPTMVTPVRLVRIPTPTEVMDSMEMRHLNTGNLDLTVTQDTIISNDPSPNRPSYAKILIRIR
jgi:hypothetical protein